MRIKSPKLLSNLFSNLRFESRPMFLQYKPQQHRVKGFETRSILDKIHTGDILLSTHSGYLSNMFIPGFWSHAAIYVGENNKIIHSIGVGVISEDILDFCRTDSICVLRLKDIKLEQIMEAIIKAKEMLTNHIQYDYDFIDNNGKVYCTELVNICYNNIFSLDYINILEVKTMLLPDGVYNSSKVDKILEFRHA